MNKSALVHEKYFNNCFIVAMKKSELEYIQEFNEQNPELGTLNID